MHLISSLEGSVNEQNIETASPNQHRVPANAAEVSTMVFDRRLQSPCYAYHWLGMQFPDRDQTESVFAMNSHIYFIWSGTALQVVHFKNFLREGGTSGSMRQGVGQEK